MTKLISSPKTTTRQLPDGPKTPSLLQMVQGIFRPMKSLEAARDRYGDTPHPRGSAQAPPLNCGIPMT